MLPLIFRNTVPAAKVEKTSWLLEAELVERLAAFLTIKGAEREIAFGAGDQLVAERDLLGDVFGFVALGPGELGDGLAEASAGRDDQFGKRLAVGAGRRIP